jgi:succinoglycan biosynthesis protein ExoW
MRSVQTRAPRTSVVIPFYQKSKGTLTRALESVADQRGVDLQALEVIIVDDASPVPARKEIEGAKYPFGIRVIEQLNGGPGAARNAGLQALVESTEYVAFLDSDDVWSADHLAVALNALERTQATFFFSNHYQLGATAPAFERGGRLDLSRHRIEFEDVYRFCGDMSQQILTGNLIGTSTVVYRFRAHQSVRFRPEYRRAGEDYLMWLDLARDSARFVFRTTPSVTYREGVNVFAGVSWGTPEHIERTLDEIRFMRAALSFGESGSDIGSVLVARIRQKQRELLRSLISSARKSPVRTLSMILARRGDPS